MNFSLLLQNMVCISYQMLWMFLLSLVLFFSYLQSVYRSFSVFQILVGSSIGGWLMLLAAIARPEKTAALVGISTAADHLVTAFNALPLEVGALNLGIDMASVSSDLYTLT